MEDIRFDGLLDCKIDNLGFVSVERKRNFIFEYKNGKEKYSFIFVQSGRMKYCFSKSGKIISADSGQVIFIPPHLPYKATYLEDNTIMRSIIFDIADVNAMPFLAEPSLLKSHDFFRVFSEFVPENMRNALFLSAKTYELIFLMQNEHIRVPKKYKKIIPAINEISCKYFENQKLSYYAELCNMSESNFRKLFKEYTGKSPIEYRNIIRVTEAKKLIDSGEFTAIEAAYMSGFNNMSFFYEVYRKAIKK